MDRKWHHADFSARWRRRSNIKADSERQYPTSYSRLIMTFGLSLTIFELFRLLILAGNSYLREKIGRFWGRMPPKCDFCLFWSPKGTSLRQNTSFEPSSVKIGAVVWAVPWSVNKYSAINHLPGPVGRQRVKDDYLCEWKTANFGPRGVETLHPISMKFGRGDYVNKLNKPAKFEIDRTKSGAATGTWNIPLAWLISRFLFLINCKN